MSGLTERLNQSALDLNSVDSIQSAIENFTRCAAERYDEHVKDLRAGTNGMETIHPEVRDRLAQQFESQAKDARTLLEAIGTHGIVTVLTAAED